MSLASRLKAPLCSAVAVVLTAGCMSPKAEPSVPSAVELIAADRSRAAAMVEPDRATLESALHAELTYTHSTGSVESKEQLIATLLGGELDYLSIESPSPLARIHGRTGVVTGAVEMRVEAGGRVHDLRSFYIAVYVLEGGTWVLVAYQSTSLRAP